MNYRRQLLLIILSVSLSFCLLASVPVVSLAQNGNANNNRAQQQSDATPAQRLSVMRSRVDALRRSLNAEVANANAGGDSGDKADSVAARLRGLEKEAGALSTEISELARKQDRSEQYDPAELDKLEAAVTELNDRVQPVLREAAGARRGAGGANTTADAGAATGGTGQKKKRGLFGRLLGRGGDDKYEDLTSTIAPGRDRQLFEEAAKEARGGRYETARSLFGVIINAYPESNYLPLAKLAIADTFYLEGTTSSLIQAAAAYQDWLAFFPTDPLADKVLLKVAESDMRQMGLPDRDVSHARRAEQRLKVLLQNYPQTSLKNDVDIRLNEVQENLAMHNLQVANLYYDRFTQGKAANSKGAQSRLREIAESYPNFSYMSEVLYRLGQTYIDEEEPDEAAKYFARILRDFPNSEFAERAGEQLDAIGIARPAADPNRVAEPAPERPSFTQRLTREMLGFVPVSVNKDGVLISRDDKKEDLLAIAVRNGGQLPTVNTTPDALVAPRRNRTPPVTTPPTGADQSTAPADRSNSNGGISTTPTRPGLPPGTASPTTPQNAAPQTINSPTTTPATAPTTPPTNSTPNTPDK